MVITRYSIDSIDKRIAVLADIHNTSFDYRVIEKEKVDLILIPGDISTSHMSFESWEKEKEEKGEMQTCSRFKEQSNVLEIVEVLPKIAPSFLSIGNHEAIWNDIDFEIIRKSGMVVLDNDFVNYSNVCICGISARHRHSNNNCDDYSEGNRLLEKVKNTGFQKIILLHEPQLYNKYPLLKDASLVVSGHAHGGQWRFFNQGVYAPGQGIFPRITKGKYYTNMIVSAGMSNTGHGIPRFGNPEEIIIIN